MDFLDKDTKRLLIAIAVFIVVALVVLPSFLSGNMFRFPGSDILGNIAGGVRESAKSNPFINNNKTITSKKDYKLENDVDYSINIETNKGKIKIDLFENYAPKNTANILSLVESNVYSNVFFQKSNKVVLTKTNVNIDYNVEDEINADYLGLNSIYVRDAYFLRSIYDPNNPNTKNFSPENLTKYEELTLKQFYSNILGYKYNPSLQTPRAQKYMVYMISSGPNTNKADFFILMTADNPEIDGRFTPVGVVREGMDILEQQNNIQIKNIDIVKQ
ncbi:MAG: peptidylprolyl isomerase [Candidatus Dojkabacteria bacterium]|nr:peptidylprolyl isomerase [Candidatus Dojkabacteria bacterium]